MGQVYTEFIERLLHASPLLRALCPSIECKLFKSKMELSKTKCLDMVARYPVRGQGREAYLISSQTPRACPMGLPGGLL